MLKETLLPRTFPTQTDREANICPAKANESDENLMRIFKYSDVKTPGAQTSFQIMAGQTSSTFCFPLHYLRGE